MEQNAAKNNVTVKNTNNCRICRLQRESRMSQEQLFHCRLKSFIPACTEVCQQRVLAQINL